MASSIKTLTDYDWYIGRKRALMMGIDELIKKYSVSAFPRVSELVLLLKCLRSFGGGQFDYFLDGLRPPPSSGSLGSREFESSVEFPVPSVLERILRQIAHDLEAFQRIADQRSMLTPLGLKALKRGDLFATSLLDKVKGLLRTAPGEGVPDQWSVITYFEKVVNVRVIPYANIVLLGMPMSCLDAPRDYLAIPHELGHIVYWRRTIPSARLKVNRTFLDKTKAEFKPYLGWQEELFADVMGARLTGPVMALDFQELENGRIGSDFLKTDDDHAMPVIRPLIYAKVAYEWGATDIANELVTRWQERVQAHVDEWTAKNTLTAEQKIFVDLMKNTKDAALDPSQPLDNIILQILGEIPGVEDDWTGNLASFKSALVANTSDPYAAFIDKIKAFDEEPLTELNVDGFEPKYLWEAWLNQEFGIPQGVGILTAPVPAGELKDLGVKPDNKWIQQWFAAGWTTEGPGSDPGKP